jgi:hypothetical protein
MQKKGRNKFYVNGRLGVIYPLQPSPTFKAIYTNLSYIDVVNQVRYMVSNGKSFSEAIRKIERL